MQVRALLLAAILGVTAAVPLEVAPQNGAVIRNSVLEELFLGLLEEFRQQMLSGSEDLPVMDPFELDHLHVELDELGIPGHVTVEDMLAKYLSTFVIDHLSITTTSLLLQRYAIVVDGHIPVIEVDTDSYDLRADAMGADIFGNGKAKLRIIEPRIHAEIEAGINLIGLSLTLRDAKVSFYLKAFEPEITGLFGSDVANDFINIFLASLIPEIVEFYHEDISELLSWLVMEYGNDILDNVSILGRTGQDIITAAMLPALEAGLEVGPTNDD